jgi:hypothetical protein
MSEKKLNEKYFEEWSKAETVDEREQIVHKCKALKDLTRTTIHLIRGTIDG